MQWCEPPSTALPVPLSFPALVCTLSEVSHSACCSWCFLLVKGQVEVRRSTDLWCSRTNADDRFALDPLGRVEGGYGVIESRDVADVRPHSSITCPPDNLTQLGAIGYDD